MSEAALRSWTREEFGRALDAGVFGPDEKLELIDGQLLTKMTANPPRATCIASLTELLGPLMGPERHLRVQLPVALSPNSQPEPDLSVVCGRAKDYSGDHPSAEHILLIVEVSDTTFRLDTSAKAALYSEAGIAELWVVDLNPRRVVVYTKPDGQDYGSIIAFHQGDKLAPGFASDDTISLADFLP